MKKTKENNLVCQDDKTPIDIILDGVSCGTLSKCDAKKLIFAIYDIKDL